MSYTPTEWESADIVTATRMNALESAVGDMAMSYTPNTWSDGDILTADKMNALEQAVAEGGGGSSDFSTAEVTVHFTFTELDDAISDVQVRGVAPVIINNAISGVYESSAFNLPTGATSKDVAVTMPLYKGQLVTSSFDTWWMGDYSIDFENIPTASGNATINLDNGTAVITGDCTLNIPVAPMW